MPSWLPQLVAKRRFAAPMLLGLALGCGGTDELERPNGDLGVADGGLPDLGLSPDMGLEDVGAVDAGSADTGTEDGGLDAGPDAGHDAGPVDAGDGLCPPAGPFGTELGDTFPNVVLPDCNGQMHALHAACDKRAAYFFVYAHW